MEKLLFTTDLTEFDNYNNIIDDEWDMMWEDYASIFELNDFYDCLLIGTVGLWHGTHKSCAYISTTKDLREKLSNYDIIRFKKDKNKLFIELSHHDGTHNFEVKRINKKGMDRLSNVYSGNEDYIILNSIETFEKWYTTNFFNKNNKEFNIGY